MELAEKLRSDGRGTLTVWLWVGFGVVAMAFVYRSFYGMRIKSGSPAAVAPDPVGVGGGGGVTGWRVADWRALVCEAASGGTWGSRAAVPGVGAVRAGLAYDPAVPNVPEVFPSPPI